MAKKSSSLSRQELMKLLVSGADDFTAIRYLRHREQTPALTELESGKTKVPGAEGALCDLYYSLWDDEPTLKDEATVRTDRQYWRGLMGEALQSGAYQELHAMTAGKELQSVLGTVSMGETVLKLVPEEDKEKLEESAMAEQKAEQAESAAAEAEADANAAEQFAAAAASAAQGGQGTPSADGTSGGAGQMSPDQAKALANQLSQQAAQARANAQTARAGADQARANAQQAAETLMGKPGSAEAEQKLRELARLGQAAMKQASEKVRELSQTIDAWGLEPGELSRKSIPEALALCERMRKNTAFKKFQQLLGRIRKMALRKALARIAARGRRVTRREIGRDIRRATRRELVALASSNPAIRAKALKRWARGELELIGEELKATLGDGPMVVCEDGSGSMEGEKQQWAKAVTLALAYFAQLQGRDFVWILFDSGVRQVKVFPKGRISAEEKLAIAEARAGGGTDFESPLREAAKIIRDKGLKKADIALLTDGECAVSDAFLKDFAQMRKFLGVNVLTVLCDIGDASAESVKQFSDRIERASAFTAEEAERKIFGNI